MDKITSVEVDYSSHPKTIRGRWLQYEAINEGQPIHSCGVFQLKTGEVGWLHLEMNGGERSFKTLPVLQDEADHYGYPEYRNRAAMVVLHVARPQNAG